MKERQFQFEWDEVKASANIRKQGVSFEMAATVYYDPRMRTIAERTVWEYFSGKATQKGVDLAELVTDVLKRDIEINEGAQVALRSAIGARPKKLACSGPGEGNPA